MDVQIENFKGHRNFVVNVNIQFMLSHASYKLNYVSLSYIHSLPLHILKYNLEFSDFHDLTLESWNMSAKSANSYALEAQLLP